MDAAPDRPCPLCGNPNRPTRRFCTGCGTRLPATCHACGGAVEAGERFCGDCGVPLAGETRVDPPRHLAEKIRDARRTIEGERKHVTVLFADVKGSMDLAERLDPERWHAILDRFYKVLADGVHRFEGTVVQFTGDGIMALFGAPIAHEDHAHRACFAALQIQDAVRRFADALRVSEGLSFSVRLGLNSGDVVVGAIGDDLRVDYTAVGHTVGLAQRMEQLAAPDRIQVSEHTARLVGGYFVFRDLGRATVKGVGEPVGVHELVGVGAVRTRLDVSRARGLTRFIGRDADLAALEAALDRARGGAGQVVGVVAEPGVGKSRLCFEFLERCRARGMTVLESRALSHTKDVPLHTILQVFRAWYGITERDDDRTAREKIAGRLLLLDDTFRDVLPLLFDFFGVSDPARPAPEVDPAERQQRVFAVLRRLVQSGEVETGVTLLEDLHWMDPASGAFLEQWVDAIAGSRNLLLLNFRPEYRADWMQRSYCQRVALAPLGADALRDLVRDLLGSDPSVGALAELIVRRTAGNPFFAEEIVQSLAERGALDGARGRYRATVAVERLDVPATVQAVLAARIDRLPEREKRVLGAAAVIGNEFAEPVLRRVVGEPDATLRGALAKLERAELVYQQAAYPAAAWAFKHPLTHEVAYGAQLSERRRDVHAAAARAIAELYGDTLDERAALLAHHWEQAGELTDAARWYARAGRWVGMRDVQAAYDDWQKVRVLLVARHDDDEAAGLVIEACGQLFNLNLRAGVMSQEEIRAVFAEGAALAERRGDLRELALLNLYHAAACVPFGDEAGRAAFGRRATEIAERIGDVAIERASLLPWAIGTMNLGRPAEALVLLDRVRDLPPSGERHWGIDDHVLAGQIRAHALAWLGRLAESRREGEAAAARAIHRDDPEQVPGGCFQLVLVAWLAGDPDGGLVSALRGLEYQERRRSTLDVGMAQGTLGIARTARGDWAEGIEALRVAVAAFRRILLSIVPLFDAQLAEALLATGDVTGARAAADDAVAVADRCRARLYEPLARIVRARIAIRERNADDAAADLTRAETLVGETGVRVCQPFVHAARAELATLLGDVARRERELREARRLFAEMGSGRA
jgi:class 3 adenylate cyclase